MASSYSTNLALTLPVQGELSGTWGTAVNTGITNMVDEALGYQAYSATGGSDTLTIPDGTTGVARSIYIQLNGTGGGTVNVPTTKTKMYFVFNNTASAITFRVTGQTGVSIPAAAKMALVSNGTDIIVAQNYFAALTLGAALPIASGGTGSTSTTFVNAATNVTGILPVANGGTATATPALVQGTGVTITGTWPNQTINATGTGGTVTSVDVSGGTTGLTTSGGPISTSGTITLAGTLAVANGGTGITSLGAGVATFLGTPSSANLASAVTGETGTGALVFATSPTLTTPLLGTPTSGTLSNCTVDGTDAVGFRNIPINSQSAAYTLVLADSGKAIFHPSSDANVRTYTIPANSSVAYPIGTAISFINMTSQVVTIAITTDTMYLSSAGTTGSRSLAQYGTATAVKMTSTTWIISGSGLT